MQQVSCSFPDGRRTYGCPIQSNSGNCQYTHCRKRLIPEPIHHPTTKLTNSAALSPTKHKYQYIPVQNYIEKSASIITVTIIIHSPPKQHEVKGKEKTHHSILGSATHTPALGHCIFLNPAHVASAPPSTHINDGPLLAASVSLGSAIQTRLSGHA